MKCLGSILVLNSSCFQCRICFIQSACQPVHCMSIYSFPCCTSSSLTGYLAFLITKWLSWGDKGTLTSQMADQMFDTWTFKIHDCHWHRIFMLKLNCTAVSNKGISSCDVGGLSKSNGWAKRWRGTIYLGAYCGMHEKRYMRFFFFPNFVFLGCDVIRVRQSFLCSLDKGQLKNFVLKLGRPGWMAMIYLDHWHDLMGSCLLVCFW